MGAIAQPGTLVYMHFCIQGKYPLMGCTVRWRGCKAIYHTHTIACDCAHRNPVTTVEGLGSNPNATHPHLIVVAGKYNAEAARRFTGTEFMTTFHHQGWWYVGISFQYGLAVWKRCVL